MKPPFRPATIAAQANGQINTATGGTVGPIETSTTFERDEAYRLPPSGDIYRRDNNATVREAEAVLNALEGAAETRLFGSGLAAIAAVMRAAHGPIALQDGTYYGTQKLGEAYAAEGRTVVRFPAGDLDALRRVCTETKPGLVVIETPSNPWLAVVDIAATAEIAHAAGALLAIDSTAATPILTRPLELGADIVMHSATKALNGHSDVLAGALVGPREIRHLGAHPRAPGHGGRCAVELRRLPPHPRDAHIGGARRGDEPQRRPRGALAGGASRRQQGALAGACQSPRSHPRRAADGRAGSAPSCRST